MEATLRLNKLPGSSPSHSELLVLVSEEEVGELTRQAAVMTLQSPLPQQRPRNCGLRTMSVR